jgi:hypothetical protein
VLFNISQQMLGLLLTTLIFIGALVGFSKLIDIEEVKKNWPKYRCRPDVMFTAGLYGHDASENLEFCLKNGFDQRAKEAMGPFYTYLGNFVSILMTLLKSINSIRMIFATIVGSVTQVFGEFSSRIQAFFYRIQTSAFRIKFLMSRIFATMTAVIFMGSSGIKAVNNFGNTFLFRFLDTFCFPPETPVCIRKKGVIPISEVKIGDVFEETGDRVTSTFQFMADGQEMVWLPGNVQVSTNHFLLHNGKWIQASEHPQAKPIGWWTGGASRPLICLNTTTHKFPIGDYIFRDYDETSDADKETMLQVLKGLNGSVKDEDSHNLYNYDTCCHGTTNIKTALGVLPAKDIQLNTPLTYGRVVGLVRKEVKEVCFYNNHIFTPGTCVWDSVTHRWKRVSQLVPVKHLDNPIIVCSFVVSPSAVIETESGCIFRDYVEIHSPDTEQAYSKTLRSREIPAY